MTERKGKNWRMIHGDCLEVLRSADWGSVDAVLSDPPHQVFYSAVSIDDLRTAWFAAATRVLRADGPFVSLGVPDNIFPVTRSMELADLIVCGLRARVDPRGVWQPAIVAYRVPKQDGWSASFTAPSDPTRIRRRPDGTIEDRLVVSSLPFVRWLIRELTKPDDVILDPLAGSGTTLLAALMEGRRGLGIERDQGRFEDACSRLTDFEQGAKP